MTEMTMPAGPNAEDDAKDKIGRPADGGHGADDAMGGTAIEPAHAASDEEAIEPFLAAAGERMDMPGAPPRSLSSRMLDYSAHAAMIVGLLGFAWTVSGHAGKAPDAPVKAAALAPVAPVAPVVDEAAALRADTRKMTADVAALRQSLEAMRGALRQDSARQDKTNEELRTLAASVDGVKTGLAATKNETSTVLAQLSTKIDHLQHADPSGKLQQVVDRLDKIEHQAPDTLTTASIPPASAKTVAVALPPVRPATIKPAPEAAETKKTTVAEAETAKKPVAITDWVVRDVYNGVAIVEGRRGPMQVVPGTAIPGAGVVKSIDRHGAGWTVTTSKGQIAFAAPPHDRLPPRDYYRPGPEDY
jgi:hypothetical protein